MPRKGKKTKHTAAEINAKIAAHKPKGGGAAGQEDRRPKANMKCLVCKVEIHNLTILRGHYEAKHPTVKLNEDDYMGKTREYRDTYILCFVFLTHSL